MNEDGDLMQVEYHGQCQLPGCSCPTKCNRVTVRIPRDRRAVGGTIPYTQTFEQWWAGACKMFGWPYADAPVVEDDGV